MEGKNIIRAQHYYHHKNDISNQFTKIFFVIPLLFFWCSMHSSYFLACLFRAGYHYYEMGSMRRGEKMPCLILLLQNRPYYHDDYHDADPSYWRQDEEQSERLKLQIARKGKIQLGDERSSRIDYWLLYGPMLYHTTTTMQTPKHNAQQTILLFFGVVLFTAVSWMDNM